jgi:hypothetical protein
LTLENPDGIRRIDADGDLVRQEAATALSRTDLVVVPVLVDGASMPTPAELPTAIVSLAKLNAFELTNTRWHYDVARLVQFARRYDKWWRRAVLRTPRLALRAAPLVLIAIVAVVAVVLASGGGPSKAAEVASCEHSHGLAQAQVTRPPRPGETQISRSLIAPAGESEGVFSQTTYATCSWPPLPGADPDGYQAITVTLTDVPGQADASGRSFMDVIESRCKRLRLMYAGGHMGVEKVFPAFVASAGDIWAASGILSPLSHITEIGSPAQRQLNLPYYPPPSAVVVLHSDEGLQRVSCLV